MTHKPPTTHIFERLTDLEVTKDSLNGETLYSISELVSNFTENDVDLYFQFDYGDGKFLIYKRVRRDQKEYDALLREYNITKVVSDKRAFVHRAQQLLQEVNTSRRLVIEFTQVKSKLAEIHENEKIPAEKKKEILQRLQSQLSKLQAYYPGLEELAKTPNAYDETRTQLQDLIKQVESEIDLANLSIEKIV